MICGVYMHNRSDGEGVTGVVPAAWRTGAEDIGNIRIVDGRRVGGETAISGGGASFMQDAEKGRYTPETCLVIGDGLDLRVLVFL